MRIWLEAGSRPEHEILNRAMIDHARPLMQVNAHDMQHMGPAGGILGKHLQG